MEFVRNSNTTRPIGLTSLIDVVFILLFFFMLTTSFVKTESMELSFPSTGEVKQLAKDSNSIRIFIHDDTRTFLENEEMRPDELKAQLRLMLFRKPDSNILLLSGDEVTVQRLVNLMDDVYLMGGKNVAMAKWDPAIGGPRVVPEVVESAGQDLSMVR